MIGAAGRSNYPSQQKPLINRLATALAQYGVYAIDLRRVNAASVDPDTAVDGVVALDAANTLGGRFAIATDSTAAGKRGIMLTGGIATCTVLGPTAVGDYLQPVSGQVYLTKVAAGAGFPTNVTSYAIAQANEAIAGAVTGNVSVDFFGSNQPRW